MMLALDTPLPVVVLGVITGTVYGLLAVGLVLVYRSDKIINFAHGEIGALGASVFGLMVVEHGIPYWVMFPAALALSAVVGAVVEVGAVRRLRNAPKLMGMVATLGFAQFLLFLSAAVNNRVNASHLFPIPSFLPEFDIGALHFTTAHFAMVFLTPVVIGGVIAFLRYTRFGLAMRAAADNLEVARLSGVFGTRMSTLSWAIAGALAAFTAILIFPTRGFASGATLGPALLLRALTAAVLGRMVSLPRALGAGVAVGVVEQILLWNFPQGGFVELVLFSAIVIILLFQTRGGLREQERGSWAAVQPWLPLPEKFAEVWTIRNLGRILAVAAVTLAIVIPLVTSNDVAIALVSVIGFSLVGLSIAVITGLAGQLSLGQFGVAGIGAAVSYVISSRTGNFPLAFLLAGTAAAGASIVIGIPALRIRGLMLAVTTLSFAVMAQAWLLQQPGLFASGVNPGRPIIGTTPLDTGKSYYFFSLVFLILGFWLVRNLRTGGFGRILIALRDNEDTARSFTIWPSLRKLQAFALGGFIAGVGGAVYTHALSRVSIETFPPVHSINIVAMSVIGGIGIIAGPLLGALYIIGVPAFVPLDSAGLAASAFGWLLLILYFPGGIAQLMRPIRDRVVDFLARLDGLDPDQIRAADMGEGPAVKKSPAKNAGRLVKTIEARRGARRAKQTSWRFPPPPRDGSHATTSSHRISRAAQWTELLSQPPQSSTASYAAPQTSNGSGLDAVVLSVSGVSRSYGGIRAVDDVSFNVRRGETLGLIGPNGAGKTTLFDLVSGFVGVDAGTIIFNGDDVTSYGPATRSRLGLVRSFQDAALFETMTVLDTVRVALERAQPTHLAAAALGLRKAERTKDERARYLVNLMGLDSYRQKQIRELSTGTRRIAELACMLALEPRLLLLDEPSSGIAQRETEALGELLARLKEQLQTTLMVIEHDMPLITGLSDRIIAMESGRIIAEDSPAAVTHDPVVIESYLGGDSLAIQRSGITGSSGEFV